VAVNFWVVPLARLASAGVTVIDDKVAGLATVRVAEPDNGPLVAVMVAVPTRTALTFPPLDTVATEVSDDDQVILVSRLTRLDVSVGPDHCRR